MSDVWWPRRCAHEEPRNVLPLEIHTKVPKPPIPVFPCESWRGGRAHSRQGPVRHTADRVHTPPPLLHPRGRGQGRVAGVSEGRGPRRGRGCRCHGSPSGGGRPRRGAPIPAARPATPRTGGRGAHVTGGDERRVGDGEGGIQQTNLEHNRRF